MNALVWVVFGGLAGWVATMLTGNDPQFGILGNIVIGIIGAYLGGWISGQLFKGPAVTGFDIRSFIIAVLGSIVLLWLVNLLL